MKSQNALALIVAYYLSRLDKEALTQLGFSSFSQAAKEIGETLNVKPNTVKNMRDEFDYHMENSRIGWRRELRGSRLKVFQTLQFTDDAELLEIVKEILENNEWKNTQGYKDVYVLLAENKKYFSKTAPFILRGPTGKKAEKYYIEQFDRSPAPSDGDLVDCRDLGCGYDFRIETIDGRKLYIEVKGLANKDGGILFTDKEWRTAEDYGENYYLAVVRNTSTSPEVEIIQNPRQNLSPTKNIHTSIQVSWSVPDKMLRNL